MATIMLLKEFNLMPPLTDLEGQSHHL